jgi:hypothetical protein
MLGLLGRDMTVDWVQAAPGVAAAVAPVALEEME